MYVFDTIRAGFILKPKLVVLGCLIYKFFHKQPTHTPLYGGFPILPEHSSHWRSSCDIFPGDWWILNKVCSAHEKTVVTVPCMIVSSKFWHWLCLHCRSRQIFSRAMRPLDEILWGFSEVCQDCAFEECLKPLRSFLFHFWTFGLPYVIISSDDRFIF